MRMSPPRTWMLALFISVACVFTLPARAQPEDPPPPRPAVRVLVPGLRGNAPEKARDTATEALHAAVASTLPQGAGVYRCLHMASAAMGLGMEETACPSGKLRVEDAFELDITHLIHGELMRVDGTHYATVHLRVRDKDAPEATGHGSSSTPDGAARDAWNALKADAARVFKLAPPPTPVAAKARKASVPMLHLVTMRAGGVGRFTVQPPLAAQPMARWAATQGKNTWTPVEMAAIPPEEREAMEADGLVSGKAARRILGDGKGPEDARLLVLRIHATRAEPVPDQQARQRTHVTLRGTVMNPDGESTVVLDQELDVECVMEPGALLPCATAVLGTEVPTFLDGVLRAATAPAEPR